MLEQQTLLEAGLEKLLEASGDQSGPVAPGSLSFASTEDRSPGSSTEEEDEYIALYQVGSTLNYYIIIYNVCMSKTLYFYVISHCLFI